MPRIRLTLTDLIIFAIANPLAVMVVYWLLNKKLYLGLPLWEQPWRAVLIVVVPIAVLNFAVIGICKFFSDGSHRKLPVAVLAFVASITAVYGGISKGDYRRAFHRSGELAEELCIRVTRAQDRFYSDAKAAGDPHYASSFNELALIDPEIPKGDVAIGPIRGYRFKLVSSQTESAIGGAKNFCDERGRYATGFGLIAWPAEHGQSGWLTYITNQNYTVMFGDLEGETDAYAARGVYDLAPNVFAVE